MDLPEKFNTELDLTAAQNSKSEIESIKSKISKSPLKPGGTNFKTHVLTQPSSSKYVYKPSTGVAIFCFIFLAVGLGVLFFSIYPQQGNNASSKLFLSLFGLVFASAGGFMFYNFYKPIVFDKELGLYYKSYNFKNRGSNKDAKGNCIPLKSIVAIQIIGERVKSKNSSYGSYELNLVLNDATRKNVIDHGNLKSIINDAHELEAFLKVPIWHPES